MTRSSSTSDCPDRDGLDVIKELRRRNVASPILILTARDGIDDRSGARSRRRRLSAQALRHEGAGGAAAGAFAPAGARARRRARGRQHVADTVIRQVTVNGSVVPISRREVGALGSDAPRRPDRVEARPGRYALRPERRREPNTVEVLISRLRKRLEDIGADRSIHAARHRLPAEGVN